MDQDQKEKIVIEVAKTIWKHGISIGEFFNAIEGQEEVIYGCRAL